MAVSAELLDHLLALEPGARLEIAKRLLESVDGGDDDTMSDTERAELDASLDRSIAQCERGEGIPAADVFRELRERRAAR